MSPTRSDIEGKLLELLYARGAGRSVCPSEVARAIDPGNWRPLMPEVRKAAASLAALGQAVVTQRGTEVDALTATGPIRIGRR